jgi:hypothetical protein
VSGEGNAAELRAMSGSPRQITSGLRVSRSQYQQAHMAQPMYHWVSACTFPQELQTVWSLPRNPLRISGRRWTDRRLRPLL